MPLPLAPLLPLALRLGVAATTGYALARWVNAHVHTGRTDQRAEDALDELGEGVSLHRPADRGHQTNATARLRRVVRLGRRTWEIDAGLIARVRLRPGRG